MITNWGYTLTDTESLEDMLSVDEFTTFSGGRYSSDTERVEAEISAASAAIRNYVGWHLSPALPCELSTFALDRRVTHVGTDIMIQLPARIVQSVESVTIDGTEYTDYYCDPNGILRVFDVGTVDRKGLIVVDYTAGLDAGMMAPIKELFAHRVTHAIAVPAGVTSEAAGGVSVTYNANWINNSRATALVADNREVLIPYRVQGVF